VWSPVVISFPHIGLQWPSSLRPKPQADFARNADYAVHTLYRDVNELGAATVEAVYSRLVVDLNRAADDVSARLVPDHPAPRPRRRPGVVDGPHAVDEDPARGHRWDRPGRGVVWASAVGHTHGSSVRILDRPLRYPELQRRIEAFHEPYQRALEVLLERRRQRFGYAILLDAHSMPGTVGPDLVVGTLDGASCHERLRRLALEALSLGRTQPGAPLLSVRLDDPYRGGETIRRFGRPEAGLHAFQLEVSRRLYMDEQTHELWTHPASEYVGPETGTPSSGSGPVPRADTRAPRRRGRHDPQGWRPAPDRRRARELGELLRRIRCLVRRLTLDTARLGLAPPDATGAAAAE
jgi:N-formylglutamate amidohydrolase